MSEIFVYDDRILQQLQVHGLNPRATTRPEQVRDALSDLYRYEIRRLRGHLLAGRVPRQDYVKRVVELRKRYWLLSVPVQLWAQSPNAS